MKTGSQLIAEERKRQIEIEGFGQNHDSGHEIGTLLNAATAYALDALVRHRLCSLEDIPTMSVLADKIFPFDSDWFKPAGGLKKQLVKTGALIAAEIDRLEN